MSEANREQLRAIKTFPQLVKYLRDELDWPIETDDFEDLTFDYEPEELGIDPGTAAKIDEIKQLRPLVTNQPWGIFFAKFEPKRLPVVVLRRILSQLVLKKRVSSKKSEQQLWHLHDLLFISNYGENDQRQITFAHFTEDDNVGGLPTLRVLGWDDADTVLHIDSVHNDLKEKLHWPDNEADLDSWREQWSSAFILRHREVITTSKALATRLAGLATRIRSRARLVLSVESQQGPLRRLHKAFQEALIHDLGEDDFADMYAQTITYGLFSAACSRPMGIIADNLADMVPITNPFLKEMLSTFLTVSGRRWKMDFDELGIQEVVDLLNSPDTHLDAVLRDFGNRIRQEDPVVHFYELFLSEYDKKKKVQRGVFYTPQPVVSYIVRSVHELLQTEFGIEDGLASTITWGEMVKKHPGIKLPVIKPKNPGDPSSQGILISPEEPFVQILDIATGTATFLVEVIDVVYKTVCEKWIKAGHTQTEIDGLWNDYVPKHLLPRLFGYELMMAPYAIAHMKLGLKLFETGYHFQSEERARIFLTNALEPPSDIQLRLSGIFPALAHEAQAVNEVKRNKRFTVVIGNPPYSGHSANQGPWISQLVNDYYYIDGKRIDEANSKWLQDDYVKFIRFGQHELQRSGWGIFSFITNHGYIDNPTFRAMRHSIMSSFHTLYLLDLHGNTKKKERSQDGTPDENIFDIQQGVGVFTAIKHSGDCHNSVKHCHLYGRRDEKYSILSATTVSLASWNEVTPSFPFWLFVPQQGVLRVEYDSFLNMTIEISERSLGILTKRDDLLTDFSKQELLAKLSLFVDPKISDQVIADMFGLPLADKDKWNLSKARISATPISPMFIQKVCYRPFDYRFIYYHEELVARMNQRVLRHLGSATHSLGLIVGRQGMATGSDVWDVCFVCNALVDQNVFRRGGGTVCPLHLVTSDREMELGSRGVNYSRTLLDRFHRFRSSHEDIFYYIYAVFHSPTFRTRYAEFLRIDFPRIPLVSSTELFRDLSRLGGELVALHLMESAKLNATITRWQGATPSSEVEKVTYSEETVWIDKGQSEGFRRVSENVWNFHIGGYQVCEKWLKDRKGRVLSAEDIAHYQMIVVALNETIRLMKEIDEVIEQHGGWPGAFK